jgi:hypothetical protein
MSAISWAGLEAFTVPASASTASSGDDWFRSLMTSFASGVATSYIWPGSGGGSLASIGISQAGNLRMANAANNDLTGGFGDGYLALNATRGAVHHIGSSWSGQLSSGKMNDHAGGLGTMPPRAVWLTQTGNFVLSTLNGDPTSGATRHAFTTPYSVAPPFFQLTLRYLGLSTSYAVSLSSVTASGFSSLFSGLTGSNLLTEVNWESTGTVAT